MKTIMANYCYFEMKILGKEKDVKKFLRKCLVGKNVERDYEDHFVFYSCSEYNAERIDNAYVEEYLCGDCPWSICSSCISGRVSENLLAKNTKAFNVTVEVWSEEYGMEFQEHYIYNNGEDVTGDYTCLGAEERELENGEYEITGGYSNYGEWTI